MTEIGLTRTCLRILLAFFHRGIVFLSSRRSVLPCLLLLVRPTRVWRLALKKKKKIKTRRRGADESARWPFPDQSTLIGRTCPRGHVNPRRVARGLEAALGERNRCSRVCRWLLRTFRSLA